MDVHAVARLRRIEQRRERGTAPFAPRHLAYDLTQHDRTIGRRDPFGGSHRDLELVRGVLGHEPLRLRAGLHERAHRPAREAPCASLGLERERQCRRSLVEQLELVLEARQHAQAELVLELLDRLAQERARAALPRPSVGLGDIAQHEVERVDVPLAADAHAHARIGQQAQVAGRAERVGLGQRAERRERVVGRHPADARPRLLVLGGQRATPDDRAEVAAHQRDQAVVA